ncbi:MAG: lipopolysaccharide biosynthesis protein [Candidatus Brocadia sp.]|nr:lipopolysaccharide biosynthesis protein [Candidatus Brocadia sp.]
MSSLRSKAGRALGWDLIGNYLGQMTGFIISIFLTRLLEPSEFGLVGMSLVFINVLNIFTDLGFVRALVQNKNNTSLTYSSVFYINILAGFTLAGSILLSAPLVGKFYGNEQVTTLVRLFSLAFVVNSFNIVQRTILRRKLDFKALSIRALTSQIIAGIAAIAFAFKGFSVYALVIQNILSAVIDTFLLWKVTEWYPKLEFSWKEVKKLTSFSAYIIAESSLDQLIQQANTLVVGKLFSPAALGFFSRANSLNLLINKNSAQSITKVFFPVLSIIQDDAERFRQVYLKAVNIVAGISIFLTGIFFLCGEELIIVLFGEKWEPSVFIFKLLILNGFTYPISSMIVNAFLAKGKSKENFNYGNVRKILRLMPFIPAFFYGFEEYLYALVGTNFINWLLNNYFVTRSLGVSFMEQANAVLPYLLITGGIVSGIHFIVPYERSVIFAGIRIGLFVTSFSLCCYLFNTLLYSEFMRYKSKVWKKLKRA